MSQFAAIGRPVRPLFSAAVGDQKSFRVRDVTGFGRGARPKNPVLSERVTFGHVRKADWRSGIDGGARYPRANSKLARPNSACLRLRNGNETGFNNRGRNGDRWFRTRCIFLITRPGEEDMSKGLNQKKDAKKKPTKTLKEKRAEKQAKKKS